MNNTLVKSTLLTSFALIAFATNSVLCRLGLGEGSIDPSSFTSIRLFSGIVVLMLILKVTTKSKKHINSQSNWISSLMLFVYALSFSYAYVSLDTATGALVLFASVQTSIIVISMYHGKRLNIKEWLGIIISFTGFVYLVLPDINSPSLEGFILMSISGVAWGMYTIQGKKSVNPLADTAYNFLMTIPFLLILVGLTYSTAHMNSKGVYLAIASGALASGLGYTVWYSALKYISAINASVFQLLVPVIAGIGGVLFIGEVLNIRIILSACIILGGILLVVLGKK